MKIKSSKVLKSLIAVILAVLMIVGTTATGFASTIDFSSSSAHSDIADTKVNSTFTKNEVLFIYASNYGNSCFASGAHVTAWFNNGGDGTYNNIQNKEVKYQDSNGNYQGTGYYAFFVTPSNSKSVQIQRFSTNDEWWNSNGDVNQASRSNDSYNVIKSTSSGTSGASWNNSTFGFKVFGSTNGWASSIGTYADAKDGNFKFTYKLTNFVAQQTSYEFKNQDTAGHWYGKDNVEEKGFVVGATYDIEFITYADNPNTLSITKTQKTFPITVKSEDSNKGTVLPTSVFAGSTGVDISASPKAGYDFDSWSATTGVSVDNTSSANAKVTATKSGTVTANFSPQTYNINYYDKGGSAFSGTHATGYPTTHTYGTATTLYTANKTGCKTITKWYTDSACTGTPITNLGAKDYTADINLYAKWEPSEHSLTFNESGSSGGTFTVDGNSFTSGNNVTYGTHSVTITAPSGYNINSVTNGSGATGTWTKTSNQVYSCTSLNITNNATVNVTYVSAATCIIKITPDLDSKTLNLGETASFTVNADHCSKSTFTVTGSSGASEYLSFPSSVSKGGTLSVKAVKPTPANTSFTLTISCTDTDSTPKVITFTVNTPELTWVGDTTSPMTIGELRTITLDDGDAVGGNVSYSISDSTFIEVNSSNGNLTYKRMDNNNVTATVTATYTNEQYTESKTYDITGAYLDILLTLCGIEDRTVEFNLGEAINTQKIVPTSLTIGQLQSYTPKYKATASGDILGIGTTYNELTTDVIPVNPGESQYVWYIAGQPQGKSGQAQASSTKGSEYLTIRVKEPEVSVTPDSIVLLPGQTRTSTVSAADDSPTPVGYSWHLQDPDSTIISIPADCTTASCPITALTSGTDYVDVDITYSTGYVKTVTTAVTVTVNDPSLNITAGSTLNLEFNNSGKTAGSDYSSKSKGTISFTTNDTQAYSDASVSIAYKDADATHVVTLPNPATKTGTITTGSFEVTSKAVGSEQLTITYTYADGYSISKDVSVHVVAYDPYQYIYCQNFIYDGGEGWPSIYYYIPSVTSSLTKMTKIATNTTSETVGDKTGNRAIYAAKVLKTDWAKATTIIFNNGSNWPSGQENMHNQTVDITIGSNNSWYLDHTALDDSSKKRKAGGFSSNVVIPKGYISDVSIAPYGTAIATVTVTNGVTPSAYSWSTGSSTIATVNSSATSKATITGVSVGDTTSIAKLNIPANGSGYDWKDLIVTGDAAQFTVGTATGNIKVTGEKNKVTMSGEGFTPSGEVGEYYPGTKVNIKVVTNLYTNYVNWTNTTVVGSDGKDYKSSATYTESTGVISFTMPATDITITPALVTKYKMSYQLVKFDWTQESATIANLKINNATTNDIYVAADSTVTYSYAFSGTMGTYYTFIGWYSDQKCTHLVSSSDSYQFTAKADTKLYAGFVRNIYIKAWYSTGSELFGIKKMNFDTESQRYYYNIPYETGKTTNLRFKYFNDSTASESEDSCWEEFAHTSSEMSEGLNINNRPKGFYDVITITSLKTNYSSPITAYYDLANKITAKGADGATDETRFSVYAKATFLGANVYLSSGVSMKNATQGTTKTAGFSYSEYTAPSGTGYVVDSTIYAIQNNENGEVNEKVIKMSQNVAKDVSVKTVINAAADKSAYTVSYYVYYDVNTMKVGKVPAIASETAGEFSATIPITGSTYITPIFESVNATSYVYFNADEIGKGSDWGPLVAAYLYNGENDGRWPGQLMVPSDDGKTFFMKTIGGDSSDTNIIFNNYLTNTAFSYSSEYYTGQTKHTINTQNCSSNTDLGLKNKALVQTYDYNQYTCLLKSGYDAITYKLKLNNDGYHGTHGHFSDDDESYSGKTVYEAKASNISLHNWKFEYLYAENGIDHMTFLGDTTDKSAGYYVIAQGDVPHTSNPNVGTYAVDWYIYDSTGKYITKVISSAMYTNVTPTGNDLISALSSNGYTYDNEAVMISYEALNKGAASTQASYDGQWYGKSTMDPYQIDMKIGTMDENQNISIVDTYDTIGDAILYYDGATKGSRTVPAVSEDAQAKQINICVENSTFHAKAMKVENSQYEFIGFYFVNGESYDRITNGDSLTADIQSPTSKTVVAVFEPASYGTGKILYNYIDRFGDAKTYTYTYRLTDEERKGYDGNSGAKTVTTKIHYYYSDNTDSWGNTPNPPTGATVINTDDFVIKHAPTQEQTDVYLKTTSWVRDNNHQPTAGQTVSFTATQSDYDSYKVKLNFRDASSSTQIETGKNGDLVVADTSKLDQSKKFAYWAADANGKSKLTNTKDFKMTIIPRVDSETPFEAYAIYQEDGFTPDDQSPAADATLKYREISGESSSKTDTLFTDTYLRFSNKDAKAIAIDDSEIVKFGVVYVSNKEYSTLTKEGKLKDNIEYPSGQFTGATGKDIEKYVKYAAYNNKASYLGDFYFDVVSDDPKDGAYKKSPGEAGYKPWPLTKFNRMNNVMSWDYNKRYMNSYSAYAFVITKDATGYADVIVSKAPADGYFYLGK